MTEAQAEQVIEAINNISLESDNTVVLSDMDYNLISSIWEELHEISVSLKRIADKHA
tara:strand:- start:47 stop:217 length:171 start_codon:yes stop_codon:yes gene_type:complete